MGNKETRMQFDNILYNKKDGIATIILNRPQKLNALSFGTLSDLNAALDEADGDGEVRVVVITGAGRAFCAGDDLGGFEEMTQAAFYSFSKTYMSVLIKLEKLTKPVIAAINGVAMGGGFELTLACDLAVASEEARFSLPEVRVGAYPGFAALRLPEIIGHRKARQLMLTGEVIDAKEAERWGLVNKVVPPDQLELVVNETAKKIVSASPLGVWLTKATYNGLVGGRETAVVTTQPLMVFSSEDFKEGVDAAFHKRQPRFKGK